MYPLCRVSRQRDSGTIPALVVKHLPVSLSQVVCVSGATVTLTCVIKSFSILFNNTSLFYFGENYLELWYHDIVVLPFRTRNFYNLIFKNCHISSVCVLMLTICSSFASHIESKYHKHCTPTKVQMKQSNSEQLSLFSRSLFP